MQTANEWRTLATKLAIVLGLPTEGMRSIDIRGGMEEPVTVAVEYVVTDPAKASQLIDRGISDA